MQFKEHKHDITVLEFLLPFEHLNLLSLSLNKRQEIIKKAGFTHKKVVEIFEYGKNSNGYWNRVKLY